MFGHSRMVGGASEEERKQKEQVCLFEQPVSADDWMQWQTAEYLPISAYQQISYGALKKIWKMSTNQIHSEPRWHWHRRTFDRFEDELQKEKEALTDQVAERSSRVRSMTSQNWKKSMLGPWGGAKTLTSMILRSVIYSIKDDWNVKAMVSGV